jgi:hypothetical protein
MDGDRALFPAGPPAAAKPRHEKHAFSSEEDARLSELVGQYGEHSWPEIEKRMPGRSSRQCRERWKLYLSPSVSNDSWAAEEDLQLIQLYQLCGPKWSIIASHFPKRTANSVKNRQKQLLRRTQRMARLAPLGALDPKLFRADAPAIVVPVTEAGAPANP